MKLDLHLYPTLNDDIQEEVEISYSIPNFKYSRVDIIGGREVNKYETIKIDLNNNEYVELFDQNSKWDVAYENLIVSQSIYIDKPSKFFGENGLAEQGSRIGVGVVWYSRDSKQRGAKHITSFSYRNQSVQANMELEFERHQLRGKLHYEIILYIDSIDEKRNSYLANEYGMVLGNVFNLELILEGDGSTFPIVSIEEDDMPLWSLYCEWNDLNDPFDESVRLRLNFKHKDYDLLNMESNKFDENLFKQIMINVVSIIIQTAVDRNEIELLEENDDFDRGTIGELIKYYIQTYEIKYDTPTDIFSSVMNSIWK